MSNTGRSGEGKSQGQQPQEGSMERDYYEPVEPRPINESGQVPGGQTGTHAPEESSESGGGMQQQASEVATKAREQMGEMAEKAQGQAETGRVKAASGLRSAAEQMRQRAGEGMQGDVASKAADQLDKTADYLHEHETSEIWEDVQQFVKEHPMQAAVGALAAGFFLGRVMR